MSVVQVCFFWCCRLFYCTLDLLLKSLNKALDPLVCCYSVVIFSQVGVATKLWNVGMLIFFFKVSGVCGCTIFVEEPLAATFAFGELTF